ncbi:MULTISPECIES: hypothetical protein [unclassified Capnocytophaga]|uniref:hypothetical protein n=1 Tax=unclassified Capnocytophaga TaxID=2640652 RepID=UPI000202F849|nr:MULTISPECIES: hypothetical protein [unclassified Capnocytophaga]EGD33667.1 ribosome biogenesis GTP-binding protein YlqF [Capnocytophaga sp. oral taxon 338 str. F0234]MEB3004495.1 hypothetical protein [Capnocytophaga sp. G2]
METLIVHAEIQTVNIPLLEQFFKRINAKKVVFEKKDPTEMSEKEYFAMIDEAIQQEGKKVTIEELRQRYLK